MDDGKSTLDLFGQGFVLLNFSSERTDVSLFEDAARARRVPLRTVRIEEPEIAALYEREFVLVRPDGHVAWRGDELPVDPVRVIDRVRGAALPLSDDASGDMTRPDVSGATSREAASHED